MYDFKILHRGEDTLIETCISGIYVNMSLPKAQQTLDTINEVYSKFRPVKLINELILARRAGYGYLIVNQPY